MTQRVCVLVLVLSWWAGMVWARGEVEPPPEGQQQEQSVPVIDEPVALGRPRLSEIVTEDFADRSWQFAGNGTQVLFTAGEQWRIVILDPENARVRTVTPPAPVNDSADSDIKLYDAQLVTVGAVDYAVLFVATVDGADRRFLVVPFGSLATDQPGDPEQAALLTLSAPLVAGPGSWTAAPTGDALVIVRVDDDEDAYRMIAQTFSRTDDGVFEPIAERVLAVSDRPLEDPACTRVDRTDYVVWREYVQQRRADLVTAVLDTGAVVARVGIGFAQVSHLPASRSILFKSLHSPFDLTSHNEEILAAVPHVHVAFTELSAARLSLDLIRIDPSTGRTSTTELYAPPGTEFPVGPQIHVDESEITIVWSRGTLRLGLQSQIVVTKIDSEGSVIHNAVGPSPRRAWSPTIAATASGTHYAWLESEPAEGYRLRYHPPEPGRLYRASGLYVHGNTAETVTAALLSLVLAVGFSLLAGTVLNAPLLLLAYSGITALHRVAPSLLRSHYRLVVTLLVLGVGAAFGISPLSFSPAIGSVIRWVLLIAPPAACVCLTAPRAAAQLPTAAATTARVAVFSVLVAAMQSVPHVTDALNAIGTL